MKLGEAAIGSIVKIKENGVLQNFRVAQHDYIQAGVTAVERVLCLADPVAFNSDGVNTYSGGTLDTFLTTTYYNRLDQDVRDALVMVKITTTNGNGNYLLRTIERNVFVFSGTEVGFTDSTLPVEGSRVDIYTDDKSRIKYSDNSPATARDRWTRSALTDDPANVWRVRAAGSASSSGATGNRYLAPVLTLPSQTQLSDNGELIFGQPTASKPFYFGPDTMNMVLFGAPGDIPETMKAGYIGDENNVPRLFYSYGTTPSIKPFADYTWAEIKEIAAAGLAQEYFNVGDEKPITLTDGSENVVQIVDFNHDAVVGGSIVPLTLCLKYLLPESKQMNATATNDLGYGVTDLSKWISNPSWANGFYSTLLPQDIKSVISPVVKSSSAGSMSTEINTWLFNAFLPSEIEVFGTTTYSAAGEGMQYELFRGETQLNVHRRTEDPNVQTWRRWWLRSPRITSDAQFCIVATGGTISALSADQPNNYILPMFCI